MMKSVVECLRTKTLAASSVLLFAILSWFALTFQFYRNFNVFVLNFILWPKKSFY